METSANDLLKTVICKRPGCERESLGATHGPYSGLCDEHTEEARRARSKSGGTPPMPPALRLPEPPVIPAEAQTLSKAAAELVKPARALEQAVLRRRAATSDAKARLADFNDALAAVKQAAEALIQ